MPIPDFQTLMLPLLRYCGDQKEHKLKETEEALSTHLGLTQSEKEEMLPSGIMRTFYNRVGWSKWYLQKAGLLQVQKGSIFKITQRGLDVLAENPTIVNIAYLKRFEEFREFLKPTKDKEPAETIESVDSGVTPQETLESAYQVIRKQLVQEMLEKIKVATPKFFEEIVVDLLVKMGYGGSIGEAGKATQYTNDEGIDGIIKEDKLCLDVIYIQAKRWVDTVIGRPQIQAFVGALDGKHANKGIFITTSTFADTADTYVRSISKKIVLIDGQQLANFMIDYNLGVSSTATFELKRIDNDYFED
jgi:restriction system protein